MKSFIQIVLCWLCVNFISANAYKAGALESANNVHEVLSFVHEAGKQNVDLLVLPSDLETENNGYDETVKTLSKASKNAHIYLVAHLKERIRCENKREIVRSNLVFDRHGFIIADYRKPLNKVANCTKSSSEISTFTTDFGTVFGVIMEEDLVLKTVKEMKGLRDIIVTGDWESNMKFLSASQFSSSWSYTNDVNLVCPKGIYAGKAGLKASGQFMVVDLANVGKEPSAPALQTFPIEDLSQYIIKPLDMDASNHGYQQILCHNAFCCDFQIKTRFSESTNDVSYGLAVFDGVRNYDRTHHIGVQSCGLFACAGHYKKTCGFGTQNNDTNIVFEKLSISANFTENTSQYPILIAKHISTDSFKFTTKSDSSRQVTAELSNSNSVLTFGIFGRLYERDFESVLLDESNWDIYGYIFNEDLQEFFDYVWIRLRILIFVVSIYILEMM